MLGVVVALTALATDTPAADVKEAQQQLISGNYSTCITQARAALTEREDHEDWNLLLSRALLATGRYEEALHAITNALQQARWSIRVRWQAREVFQSNGQADRAREMVESVLRTIQGQPRSFRDAPNLVVLGQAALLANADPKKVLDTVFEAARKDDPKNRDVYLSMGNLALEKHDYALAAKHFNAGLKELPGDPDLQFGLAQAYAPSDPALMQTALETALSRNSNHVGCLMLLAEYNMDGEDYDAAERYLARVDAVNPFCPDAWAYRAVLAHLHNQPEGEETARKAALKFWRDNPRVDYLIGHKLSQYYRFAEGSAHQRQALEFDSDYLPAKGQLAQDLLRLGQEQEGWQLTEEVQKQDGYDVEAFNLSALHEAMKKYVTLTNRNFIVRMQAREAAVYGQRVLDLLERARTNLCAKYGMELRQPTLVEMFAEQKDFAVRTFGMPGNPGYLGVSFGSVVTATSPASHPSHSVNWQTVLWHEFCHVVTLQLTKNKMPRWLSEGISVYEERQADPAWGERITPRYREMTLSDDLKPVSKLSAAFLAPRSEAHLQFAYYESSLVVEFIVQRYGMERLKQILSDLGEGVEINQALAKRTVPMDQLETEFTEFAQQKARDLAPGLDWEKPPGLERGAATRLSLRQPRTAETNSSDLDFAEAPAGVTNSEAEPGTNFWRLVQRAEDLVESKKWAEAKAPLEKLVKLYPEFIGPDCAYRLLAAAHRELGETNAERQVLAQLAARDDSALGAYRRLMELGAAAKDWPEVAKNAQRYTAVDPLVALPYKYLGQAADELGDTKNGIMAYRAMLALDPADPAEVHFKLAKLLQKEGNPEAKRQVLEALEEAPRYREALKLLLEIEGSATKQAGGT
jgi:tetratricopeptide (TPR) repeat protein